MVNIPAFIVADKQSVYNLTLSGIRVISITDDDGKDPMINMPNYIKASILLPPYEALSLELDGKYAEADYRYENWLCGQEPMSFIYLIALAVLKGIPIALYFDEDTAQMRYVITLLNFIGKVTGLTFGAGTNYGSMRDEFIPINLANLMIAGLIDCQQFIMMMPVGVHLVPQAISMLINYINPPIKHGSPIEVYDKYFMDLIANSHQVNKPLRNPIVIGG